MWINFLFCSGAVVNLWSSKRKNFDCIRWRFMYNNVIERAANAIKLIFRKVICVVLQDSHLYTIVVLNCRTSLLYAIKSCMKHSFGTFFKILTETYLTWNNNGLQHKWRKINFMHAKKNVHNFVAQIFSVYSFTFI